MKVISKNGQLEVTRTKTVVWRSGQTIVREVAHHSANGVLHADGGMELGDEFRLERFFPGVSGKAFVDHLVRYSSRTEINFESEGKVSFRNTESDFIECLWQSAITGKEKDALLLTLGTIYEFEDRKVLVNAVNAFPGQGGLWDVCITLHDVSKDETGLVSKGAFTVGKFPRFDEWNKVSL